MLFVFFVPFVLFVLFVLFVCAKSFCKKNKKFKTALITSFILQFVVFVMFVIKQMSIKIKQSTPFWRLIVGKALL